MITWHMHGTWMGYFRTESTTASPEDFVAYLEVWKLKRDGNKLYDIRGVHCGTIEKDTDEQVHREVAQVDGNPGA